MSHAYLEKLEKEGTVNMREWCKRPGKKNENGEIQYFTQQNHKKECDVNLIIKKYDKTGIISHVQKMEAKYGDVTGADFRAAQDLYIRAQSMFEELPSDIRKRFSNDASEFLSFMEDENNRSEAEELGLIKREWKEETDGIGEHVKSADDYEKKDSFKGKEVA